MLANKNFYISIFLHSFVAFCIALYIYVADFFVEEKEEEKFVFEMVQDFSPPSPNVADSAPPEITPVEAESFIEKLDIKSAEALVLPDPVVIPPPNPVERIVEKPSSKPVPKPKEEPKYEVVTNIADYNKSRNLKPQTTRQTTQTKPKPINVQSVKSGFNVERSVKTSNISAGNSGDALRAYLNSLKILARSKYILPEGAKAINLTMDICFNISPTGKISGVRMLKSSGNSIFDNSVISLFSGLQSFAPPNSKGIENVRLTFESI